jgi:uncharacterized zinc-type alcohol dehydrogenase-like protein
MKVHALAVQNSQSALQAYEYELGGIGPWEVDIEISHCGICHSDLHLISNDWGFSTYPLVPGHEVVGVVRAHGKQAKHLPIGARVGLGWQCGACFECAQCLSGDENMCPKSVATCAGHFGGFADFVRADSRFVFPLPEELSSEKVAPLLCGGITVFSPLQHFGVTSSMKVGVVGVGGLGHLALQFLNAFGCEVTAFSTTSSKENEAREFGANNFLSLSDKAALKAARSSLDFIISTAFAPLDYEMLLNTLRPNGKLCLVGVPEKDVSFPGHLLIGGRKSICGSPIGSRSAMRTMLEFAARHDIGAKVELMPMKEANEALKRIEENKARYRIVLTN